MPYREARSVAESSEGPTASRRLVWYDAPAPVSGGTAFFSLVQTFRQRMRKCSGSSIARLPKKTNMLVFFLNKQLTFQLIL